MGRSIGILLIASSILSMLAGALIDARYSSSAPVTGNVISNILSQPDVELGFGDYAAGVAVSYSIISLIIGVVFLARI